MLAAANALLSNLQSGEPTGSSNPVQASIDELQGLGYVCDESGCVLVLPGDRSGDESECFCWESRGPAGEGLGGGHGESLVAAAVAGQGGRQSRVAD